jgi:hypothetical protein
MSSLLRAAVIIAVAISIPVIPSLQAAWLENGTPVCTAADDQAGQGIIEDGFGNLIIIWEDSRSGNKDIYAQKFDIYGNMLWAADGVPVCTMTGDQEFPSIVSDGSGGAIIAWQDRRSGSYRDIYAQRLDANGSRLWLLSGVSVCTATEDQWYPRMTSDGSGGAILAWRDYRDGAFDANIYAQRIDGTGASLWTAQGIAIVTATGNQYLSGSIASDGDGGAYLAWGDERNGISNPDIYIQWIDSSGSLGFSADGYALCDEPDYQNRPVILSNGYHSVIVVWRDSRGGLLSLYGSLIYNNSVYWGSNGTEICSLVSGFPDYQVLVPDGEGGAIVFWADDRNGDDDIYAQRVDAGGNTLWTEDGVVVCDAILNQRFPMAVSDGDGGAIAGWYDYRKNVLSEIYLQRLDGDGNVLWIDDGVRIDGVVITQYYPLIASDGEGGAIVSWVDYPDDPYDSVLYIQRIERNGYWGYPAPEIHAAQDVPDDQGGYVNLEWYSSRLDPWPDQEISYYSIWKALNPVTALSMKEAGAAFLTSPSELTASGIGPDADIPIIREQVLGSATYFWELIDTQDAQYYEEYSKVLATDFDSYLSTSVYSYYQVAAHTSDPLVVWTSLPDSGYSVDNLAPTAPLGLTGVQVFTPEGMELSWESNIEEDLYGYRIYKGTSSDFIPDEGFLVGSTDEPEFFDGDWRWDITVWYKVTAVDIHDNESSVAVLAPEEITGEEDLSAADFLAQNHPNPFNPATRIVFGMRNPGPVSLRIYDASGRLVRTLVDENRAAGTYDEIWRGTDGSGRDLSSGVYFYKLVTGEYTDTRKMVLLR